MAISDKAFAAANRRGAEHKAANQQAVSARVVSGRDLVVSFASGAQLRVPVKLIEGLSGASVNALKHCEVSPAGLGIHFPGLDADVYVPALMQGVFGSAAWQHTVSSELAARGGRQRTEAKAAAARRNSLKGGRPKRSASV